MWHDDIRVYKFGDRLKIVFFKYGIPTKKLTRDELRVLWYECYSGDGVLSHKNLHFSGAHTVYDYIHACEKAAEAQERIERKKELHKKLQIERDDDERFKNSVSRSRSRVYELAMCNEFQYFCTFTINQIYKNRKDLTVFSKDFGQMIRNFNRKFEKNVKYVIVPEKHATGEWHAHGLLLGLANEDFVINQYGYREWKYYSERFGFINIQDIDNRTAIAAYITKYITKDLASQALPTGAHLFYASQGLKGKEDITQQFCYEDLKDLEYDFENDYVKILWLDL